MGAAESRPADLFAGGPVERVLWGALAVAFVLDAAVDLGRLAGSLLWVVPLAAYGLVCAVNAWRCGRVHCYLTGPFLLGAALLLLLHGVQLIDLGPNPGRWLAPVLVVGFLVLRFAPERRWGRYRGGSGPRPRAGHRI